MPGKHLRFRSSAVVAAAIAAVLLSAPPAPATAQKGGRAATYYEDALARYARQDAAGAIIQLKNALREEPNSLPSLVLLGKALLDTGEPVGAEESFAKALQLGVDRSEVAVPMAQALVDQAKFAAVLERFPAESVPASRRAELLVLRGQAHKGLGDLAAAATAFEAALGADRRSVNATLALADMRARQGKWGEAESLVDQGLVHASADARLLALGGALALGRGDMAKALAAYDKAVAANPRYLNARVARASILLQLGRLDAAFSDLEQLKKDHPTDPRVNQLRARYFARRGDDRAAREALRETVAAIDTARRDSLKQRAPESLLMAGVAYAELQEREKARSYLEDYLRIEPRHPGARKVLGSVLLAQGDTLTALAALEEANRRQPDDPEILSLIAAAYAARRQYQTATRYLEEAVKASGGAPAMEAALGLGLLQQGRTELGIQNLERAVAKDPGNVEASVTLTVAYLKRGDSKRALAVAEQVSKRAASNPVGQNLLGMAREAAGDRKAARTAYERALQLEPGLLASAFNLARLDTADGAYDAARRRLGAILKDRPREAQAMMEFARVEEAAGRLDEATRWLEKVRALQRKNENAVAWLVDLYLRTRDRDKALAVAREAEGAMPDNPIVLAALGRAQLAVGDQKNAQLVFTRLSRLAGAEPATLVAVGWLQLQASDPRGAAYTAEKALNARPDLLPAQALLIEIDLRSGDLSKAEQRAKAVLAKNPGSPLGNRLVADVAMARKSYPQAIEGYRKALASDPSTEGALRLYRAYVQSGAASKGNEFMQGWIKERPKDVVAVRALAEGRLATGDLKGARAGYETVLKLAGEDPVLLNNLATILARDGDRDALQYAERAHRLAPNDAFIQDTLGWVLVEQGRVQEGLQHLREARLRNSGNPEIRYHLAAALAKAGRRDEARTELEPLIRDGTAFPGAEDARRLWQTLAAK